MAIFQLEVAHAARQIQVRGLMLFQGLWRRVLPECASVAEVQACTAPSQLYRASEMRSSCDSYELKLSQVFDARSSRRMLQAKVLLPRAVNAACGPCREPNVSPFHCVYNHTSKSF
jgi:hypothetical protein